VNAPFAHLPVQFSHSREASMSQQVDPLREPEQPTPGNAATVAQAHHLSQHSLEQQAWAHVQHTPLASMWDLQGVPLKDLAKRTFKGIDEDNIFGRASQLAYSFFAAIFPALIAMSSLMGLIARSSGQLYFKLLGKIGQLIPPSAFALVTETFQKTTSASTTGKVTFGLLFALFSASVGISAIQDTLNAVYKVKETRAFWKARLEAIGLTVLVAALVTCALLTLFAGDYLAHHIEHLFRGAYALSVVFRIVYWIAACLLMVLSFEVMYYFCPDVQNSKWRWFTPGGMIGLLGWVAGSLGLRVYLHFFNTYSLTYGSLGAVIILLLWFYLTGAMILLGGEVNSDIEHAVAEKKIKSGECALPTASAVAKVDMAKGRSSK
jgi:membrane protein